MMVMGIKEEMVDPNCKYLVNIYITTILLVILIIMLGRLRSLLVDGFA